MKNKVGQEADLLDDALAALIASTKRINRKLDLVEISNKLEIARSYLGNLNEIANAIGLSHEMVRSFARVSFLDHKVKRMIKEGRIKSVDIADRLSRLPRTDQFFIAKEAVKRSLSSHDIRAIVSLRKALPDKPIDDIVKRINKSRNIKEYIAEYVIPQNRTVRSKEIQRHLNNFFGRQHIRAFSIKDGAGRIILDKNGKEKLSKKAQKMQISKGRLLQMIIQGEVKERE